VEDTNLHHRGGINGAKWATENTKIILNSSCSPTHAQIEALDDAFITRNLSPGGCADLLAVTYFLHTLYS
jgi:triphosphoribosyl-dephospho-CoA synthetase